MPAAGDENRRCAKASEGIARLRTVRTVRHSCLRGYTNMAAVREYFETDFGYALRVHTRIPSDRFNIEIVILYDFSGYKSFLACYDADSGHTVQYYVDLLSTLKLGATELQLSGKVVLPSARDFPGHLQVNNVKGPFDVLAKFHADPNWISSKDLQASVPARMFIYSESDLSEDDVLALKTKALPLGYEVQYRSKRHASERSKFETPVGFISYDSRDRDISRRIAVHLNKMICPVWYDEFSLKVGDNLRESIETGLKECHKCILLLSRHFLPTLGGQRGSSTPSLLGKSYKKKSSFCQYGTMSLNRKCTNTARAFSTLKASIGASVKTKYAGNCSSR
jgi:hypothetical protein